MFAEMGKEVAPLVRITARLKTLFHKASELSDFFKPQSTQRLRKGREGSGTEFLNRNSFLSFRCLCCRGTRQRLQNVV